MYSDYGDRTLHKLQTELVVSDDIMTSEKGYVRGPERGLFAALLFDGVQNFINFAVAETGEAAEKYREAYNWVSSRGIDYIFSFDNVCEALGINASYLRLGLINASNSQYFEWKKTRRAS